MPNQGGSSLQLTFDKSHIITIGEKLYGESLELLRELISNAYDADATRVWIEVEHDCLKIRDDGSGMDEGGLREFFNIGSQNKKHSPVSPKYKRPRIGQFGIGKFAVLTACDCFKIHTQKDGFSAEVIFDKNHWLAAEHWTIPLETQSFNPMLGNGTTIILENLKKIFPIPEIERFIRERLPLNAPHIMSPSGELDETSEQKNSEKFAPEETGETDDWIEAMNLHLKPEGGGDFDPNRENTEQETESSIPPPKKIKVKDLRGKTMVARRIKIGGIGVTCSLENCGKESPPAFSEGGIIYINQDHPLYQKQQKQGKESMGFYLAYLISQQVALMLTENDPRRAFEVQNRLLTDSL